ncbi:Choline dehydrogenase [Tistlia consotensis]|uniref:Choline dehydrogenase n=1 Tax=Tistlia consotensis USBA 355 TaxID=560819 RepID=A0A1Y6B8U0_9PROT|nr:GMC family oxidoreductase [Tistlia consotensis]SME98839.1 Choline dehydrogenase [Tistlia consotensis USBA 355]SNR58265.1 Choline dehydrogenase [Tistlia consotensis]
MTESLDCEILVVGSGPGGAVTAAALAAAGRDVLLVEEGPDTRRLATRPYSSEEMDAKYRNAGLTPCLGKARVTYAEGRCLGGGSEVNSGFFHRLPEETLARWQREHGFSDVSLDALAPLYDEIGRCLGVGPVEGGEGAASAKLRAGAEALGWASQEVPRWITSRRDEAGRWTSTHHGMSSTYVADALAAGCRLETGVRIERLTFEGARAVAASGRRLAGYRAEGRLTIRFREVFICAGATGTPALLRRSGLRRNVGTALQLHPMLRAIARFDEPVDEGDFGVPVRQVMEFKPDLTLGCSVSALPHLALWLAGQDRELLIERQRQLAIFYALVTSESRGSVRNLPGLSEPLVRFDLSGRDHDRLADGLDKLVRLLFAAGAREVHLPLPGAGPIADPDALRPLLGDFGRRRPEVTAIHLFASAPMGGDPERHPVDLEGRLRGTDNVRVNDVSMLPGCTGVNPQATVMAFARRNAAAFLAG